jgi:hypothetical protein
MNEYEVRVVNAMEKYGGSFVKALAKCFWCADDINKDKLKSTFLEYWIEYEKWVEHDEQK